MNFGHCALPRLRPTTTSCAFIAHGSLRFLAEIRGWGISKMTNCLLLQQSPNLSYGIPKKVAQLEIVLFSKCFALFQNNTTSGLFFVVNVPHGHSGYELKIFFYVKLNNQMSRVWIEITGPVLNTIAYIVLKKLPPDCSAQHRNFSKSYLTQNISQAQQEK